MQRKHLVTKWCSNVFNVLCTEYIFEAFKSLHSQHSHRSVLWFIVVCHHIVPKMETMSLLIYQSFLPHIPICQRTYRGDTVCNLWRPEGLCFQVSLHSTSLYSLFSDINLDHRCCKLLPSRFSVKEPICKVPEVVQGFTGCTHTCHTSLNPSIIVSTCIKHRCVFVLLCKDKETPKPEAAGKELTANMHMCELFHQQQYVCLPSGLPISLPQPGTQAGDQAASHAEASGAQDHQGQELSDDGWQTVEKRCYIYIYIYERVDWTANCILRLSGFVRVVLSKLNFPV